MYNNIEGVFLHVTRLYLVRSLQDLLKHSKMVTKAESTILVWEETMQVILAHIKLNCCIFENLSVRT